jgi:LIM domain
VAASFFPIEVDGKVQPLCERDYFRRLNLVCATCGEALKGSYITALGQKYHVEHFTCSLCPTAFGPEDSYYENDGKVFCHYHYSLQFAVNCAGCETAILKQFVEIDKNSVNEHWHPECYMINRFWNVKLSQTFSEGVPDGLTETVHKPTPTASELKKAQSDMEDQMYQIWTVLSAFEESAAACISDMLLHVSNGAYIEGVNMAKSFITHVDILFAAIDSLKSQFEKVSDSLLYTSEAKRLCKKIVNFFSLLSHTQESGMQMIGITEELLSLVTGLAHYLKILIRIALSGALKLEKKYHSQVAIPNFLNDLMQLASREERAELESGLHVTSDLCQVCKITCEEECYRYHQHRWHCDCFKCSSCHSPLQANLDNTKLHLDTMNIYCNTCTTTLKLENIEANFDYVTKLQQYSFLLRVALRRLYTLLDYSGKGSIRLREFIYFQVLNLIIF